MTERKHGFPHIIDEEDINKILDAIEKEPSYLHNNIGEFLKARDSAAILLMYYLFARPSEILLLQWEDINLEKKEIRCKPYFNKVRINIPLAMTPEAERIFIKYKSIHDRCPLNTSFLFPSLFTGNPITEKAFSKRFREIAKKSGLCYPEWIDDKGCTRWSINLYSLRHSSLTKAHHRFDSDAIVSKLARHTNISSSRHYIHLDDKDRKRYAQEVFS